MSNPLHRLKKVFFFFECSVYTVLYLKHRMHMRAQPRRTNFGVRLALMTTTRTYDHLLVVLPISRQILSFLSQIWL